MCWDWDQSIRIVEVEGTLEISIDLRFSIEYPDSLVAVMIQCFYFILFYLLPSVIPVFATPCNVHSQESNPCWSPSMSDIPNYIIF